MGSIKHVICEIFFNSKIYFIESDFKEQSINQEVDLITPCFQALRSNLLPLLLKIKSMEIDLCVKYLQN